MRVLILFLGLFLFSCQYPSSFRQGGESLDSSVTFFHLEASLSDIEGRVDLVERFRDGRNTPERRDRFDREDWDARNRRESSSELNYSRRVSRYDGGRFDREDWDARNRGGSVRERDSRYRPRALRANRDRFDLKEWDERQRNP